MASALALLPRDRLAVGWSRRGRQMRTVTCNPEEAFAAYLTTRACFCQKPPAKNGRPFSSAWPGGTRSGLMLGKPNTC